MTVIIISAVFFFKRKEAITVLKLNNPQEKMDDLDKIFFIKNDENIEIFNKIIYFINMKEKKNKFSYKNKEYEFDNFLSDRTFFFNNFNDFFPYERPNISKNRKIYPYKKNYIFLTYILFWSAIIERKNCLKTNVKESARQFEIINPIETSINKLKKINYNIDEYMKEEPYKKLYLRYKKLKK